MREKELKAAEFDKIFSSFGKSVFWATLSGGEPFLRQDLPQICQSLSQHCEPRIVNIPTNSLVTEVIESTTKKILEKCDFPSLIVNLSLDGLKEEHDRIRNVPGNFAKFDETYQCLKKLRSEFPNLHIGIHSVVSKYSIDKLFDVYEYARNLGSDSYITEIAENRSELFNKDKDITPDHGQYATFVKELVERMKRDGYSSNASVPRTTRAFRLAYYELAAEVLQKSRQAVSCYAGYASCQISAFGDVWPCCILGYDFSMGNLRDFDYNFRKIWLSPRAQDIRNYIRGKNCACPLANAHYTNMICNLTSVLKVVRNMVLS
jgi:MoaA/NifB/PqqE/SkfB family radical SAM enzyme